MSSLFKHIFLFMLSIFSGALAASNDRVFVAERGMVLIDHVISTHHVTSPIDCSFQCSSINKCKSYNYKPRESGADQDICQLNNATRQTAPAASFKPDAGSVYYFDQSETYKSCLDYARHGARENGIYTITDASGDSYPVFCDLTSEPRSAWTLVLSMAFKNKNMAEFCTIPLTANAPVKENSPNWDTYRLSLSRMEQLSNQSTRLHLTTGFPVYGVDFVDYLRAKLSNVNVITISGDKLCRLVEYINIRGNKARDLLVPFWQSSGYSFHTDSSSQFQCQFDGSPGSVWSENNFGCHCGNSNPKFRGSMGESETTEYWFGGYL